MTVLAIHYFRYLETYWGYLHYSYLLGYLIIIKSIIHYLLGESSLYSAGFSGAILGLMTIYPSETILGFDCQPQYYSTIVMFIIQLIPGHTFFYGHLSGIIAGYIFLWIWTSLLGKQPQPTLLRQRKSHLAGSYI